MLGKPLPFSEHSPPVLTDLFTRRQQSTLKTWPFVRRNHAEQIECSAVWCARYVCFCSPCLAADIAAASMQRKCQHGELMPQGAR